MENVFQPAFLSVGRAHRNTQNSLAQARIPKGPVFMGKPIESEIKACQRNNTLSLQYCIKFDLLPTRVFLSETSHAEASMKKLTIERHE
jgi:hypothetical protein